MTDLYSNAKKLGLEADAAKSDKEALRLYREAWKAVPEPRFEWDGGTWIWNCISGIYFDRREYSEALDAAKMAEKSYRGTENTNTLFLLGMIYLDGFNDLSAAEEYFRRAWKLSDGRVFRSKPKRYLKLLKETLSPDSGLTSNESSSVPALVGSELPRPILNEIKTLCADGDKLFDKGRVKNAIQIYEKALVLLPPPAEDWQAYSWIQSAIGNAFFSKGDWIRSENAFQKAKMGPGGLDNPFIHLRLGQCAFERGNIPLALDELMRAYMFEGEKIFSEDWKYLEFLKNNVSL